MAPPGLVTLPQTMPTWAAPQFGAGFCNPTGPDAYQLHVVGDKVQFLPIGAPVPAGAKNPTPLELGFTGTMRSGWHLCTGRPGEGESWPATRPAANEPFQVPIYALPEKAVTDRAKELLAGKAECREQEEMNFVPLPGHRFSEAGALSFLDLLGLGKDSRRAEYCVEKGGKKGEEDYLLRLNFPRAFGDQRVKGALRDLTGLSDEGLVKTAEKTELAEGDFPHPVPFFGNNLGAIVHGLRQLVKSDLERQKAQEDARAEQADTRKENHGSTHVNLLGWLNWFIPESWETDDEGNPTMPVFEVSAITASLFGMLAMIWGMGTWQGKMERPNAVLAAPFRLAWNGLRSLRYWDISHLRQSWDAIAGKLRSGELDGTFNDRTRDVRNRPAAPFGELPLNLQRAILQIRDGLDRLDFPHVLVSGASGGGKDHTVLESASYLIKAALGLLDGKESSVTIRNTEGFTDREGRPLEDVSFTIEAFEGPGGIRYIEVSAQEIIAKAGAWANRAQEYFNKIFAQFRDSKTLIHVVEADKLGEAGSSGTEKLNLLPDFYRIMEDERNELIRVVLSSTRARVILEKAKDLWRRLTRVELIPPRPSELLQILRNKIDSYLSGRNARARARYQRVQFLPEALRAITALGHHEGGAPPSAHLRLMETLAQRADSLRQHLSPDGDPIEVKAEHVIDEVARLTHRSYGEVQAELQGLLSAGTGDGISENRMIQERIMEAYYRHFEPLEGQVNPLDVTITVGNKRAEAQHWLALANGQVPESAATPVGNGAPRGNGAGNGVPPPAAPNPPVDRYRPLVQQVEAAHHVTIDQSAVDRVLEIVRPTGPTSYEEEVVQGLLDRAAMSAGARQSVTADSVDAALAEVGTIFEQSPGIHRQWESASPRNRAGRALDFWKAYKTDQETGNRRSPADFFKEDLMLREGADVAGPAAIPVAAAPGPTAAVDSEEAIRIELRDRYPQLTEATYNGAVDFLARDILTAWEQAGRPSNGGSGVLAVLPPERFIEEGVERALQTMETRRHAGAAAAIRRSDQRGREERGTTRLEATLRRTSEVAKR